ncbi:DUF2235 domain-containing protein [Rhodobacteraceae bacterium KMM 6894]|nr:DUF2235 domain-containing protein [Rhodobacteraceae bacterium KMM 6894]
MTRIAIFCDGTWNSPDIFEPTHVASLSAALVSDPAKGQVAAYFAGIGTDTRFDGPVGKFLNKWGGGAFGWGLDAKVKQAYQFIARIYRPGDSLYVFGFSRGAYTARSVVGMIRKCGIVADTSEAGINAAFDLYRIRGKRGHPDHPDMRAARAEMSPGFATSRLDLEDRSTAALVNVAYVGVWDTVGARGIPPSLLGPVATLWNRQYRFHDMQLSSLVRRARHALALDEMRVFFRPALWDNLEGDRGLNRGDISAARPYQQMWFIGNHSIVGGSAGVRALSAFPLGWMLEGAPELTLKPGHRVPPHTGDATVVSALMTAKPGLLSRWRTGPKLDRDVHVSVRARIEALRSYRPGSLRWRERPDDPPDRRPPDLHDR